MREENSYGNILRRMSAFGGVQALNILVSLIRGKFVALFLGPEGMGVSSLFVSAQHILQQFAGLGVNLSAVKETAAAQSDSRQLPAVAAAVIRLALLTALFGSALCLLLSPLLSWWTFGTTSYTLGFMLLSLAVGLTVAANAYLALLQGIGAVKQLTKASLVGSVTGLVCGVPLYYWFGTRGIVPALIILAGSMFAFYYFSFRRTPLGHQSVPFRWREHAPLLKRLLALGVTLMIGALAGTLCGYLINAIVRAVGSVEDVGYYQAANSITAQYVGIITSALALDYFPRLSAAASDPRAFNAIVNRQIEIVALLLTPLAVCLILTAPLIIRILLTEEFLHTVPLMRWLGLGLLIQLLYFPLGYIFIVKDDRRLYLWVEVIFSNLLWIASSIGFYLIFGLVGLGMSLGFRCLIDQTVAYIVLHRHYGTTITPANWRNIFLAVATGAAAFGLSYIPGCPIWIYVVIILVICTCCGLTLRRKLKNS